MSEVRWTSTQDASVGSSVCFRGWPAGAAPNAEECIRSLPRRTYPCRGTPWGGSGYTRLDEAASPALSYAVCLETLSAARASTSSWGSSTRLMRDVPRPAMYVG